MVKLLDLVTRLEMRSDGGIINVYPFEIPSGNIDDKISFYYNLKLRLDEVLVELVLSKF